MNNVVAVVILVIVWISTCAAFFWFGMKVMRFVIWQALSSKPDSDLPQYKGLRAQLRRCGVTWPGSDKLVKIDSPDSISDAIALLADIKRNNAK